MRRLPRICDRLDEGFVVPSDDDFDPVAGVQGVFALGAIMGSGAASYFSDLRTAIVQLFGRDGLEAALLQEQAKRKAEVLALAVIADGVITEAEHDGIRTFATKHRIDPAEAIATVSSLAEAVRDPAVLREKVAQAAAPLSPEERLEVFVVVKNFAHRGSRAWPEDTGYRGASGPTPEGLIAAFREGLGITAAPVAAGRTAGGDQGR